MENNHLQERWTGAFIASIGKVQRERVAELSLSQQAVQYLDRLLIRLLLTLLSPVPKTLQEAQDQIFRKLPEPLSSDAIEDWNIKTKDKGKKKILISIDKVQHILKDASSGTPEKHVSQFFAAILEYMLSDVLKLTANYVQNIRKKGISEQDIKIAMYADNVLVNIFQGDDADEDVPLLPITIKDDSDDVSYEALVKNVFTEELRYLKDLQLIIKVFKKEFLARPSLFTEADIELIFSNIEDIAEMSSKLLVLLEEAKEMTDENNPVPLIGTCFADLADECSFELYSEYTLNYTEPRWYDSFSAILQQASIDSALKSVKVEGFRDMVKYVLPNLLLAPINHGLNYFEQIQMLERTAVDSEDGESLTQTISTISQIKVLLENRALGLPMNKPSEVSLRISWKGGVQAEKMKEIEESIEGWIGKTIRQSCNEFIYEGDLKRWNGKRSTERRVFLFDSLLVCCKHNQVRRPIPSASHEYRLKEKILLRKTSIIDEENLQFTVVERLHDKENRWTFICLSADDKHAWMSHLVRLQYRSTYDRVLDQVLRKEIEEQPLRLPEPDVYRFAEPDSDENLILDHEKSIPMIKGGTVRKLVERLTYHKYCDSSFTKTFLTTFRSFCKPSLLLDLLIERFHIPEPPPSPEQQAAIDRGEILTRDDLKRFRNEYAQPIQLRVLNVLRQWLEFHWYDFETDADMLQRVEEFVASIRGTNRQKLVRTMEKLIARKRIAEDETPTFTFASEPPVVEWHVTHDKTKFSITSLHPIEIARQLTLLEFDLYRKVQPSELVGTVWTKSGKEENSPNLLRMIHCSTTVTRWLCRSIVETKNFEERTAVTARAVEIMQALKKLNNFNGMLEFVAAFNSSAIHRLNHTKQNLPDRLTKIMKECVDLCDPRLTKCLVKLRSCDPPCVPFVGTFLTNILKTEEGNPHLLPNYPEKLELINFAKRRMVASILFDIQQYQNQPYNLRLVPEIREYFTSLQPFTGFDTEKQFNDYIYKCSLELEPRQSDKAARFPRQLPDKEIRSPGIIPSKKSVKNLYRDESKISLLERRNSNAEEDTVSIVTRTPKTPVTPVSAPPPCPPREPMNDNSVPIPSANNVFDFNIQFGGVEEVDAPPPLPPRDDVPLNYHYVEPEPEFFLNEDIINQHHPYNPSDPRNSFMLPEIRQELPRTEPTSAFYSSGDFSHPVESGFFSFNHVSGNDQAPPVPPRDACWDDPIVPSREPHREAPAIPPRDPHPSLSSYPETPMSASRFVFSNHPTPRYVPEPSRQSSRFGSNVDTPPPIPRRQPTHPHF